MCFYSVHAQISFGIQVGIALSKVILDKETIENGKSNFTLAFKVGTFAEISFRKSLYFNPEINFVMNGGKYKSDVGNMSASSTTYYIEIPLNIAYKYNLLNATGNILFGAGPTINYRIGGKYKSDVNYFFDGNGTIKFDSKKDTFDDCLHLKGLDIGANIFAGYEFSKFRALLQFRPSFANISPYSGENEKYKNMYIAFIIGYKF